MCIRDRFLRLLCFCIKMNSVVRNLNFHGCFILIGVVDKIQDVRVWSLRINARYRLDGYDKKRASSSYNEKKVTGKENC